MSKSRSRKVADLAGGTYELEFKGNTAVLADHSADIAEMVAGAEDFFSTPSYSGTVLRYTGPDVSGTTFGVPQANLSSVILQNCSNGVIGTNGSSPLILGTASEERLRIDASGNIGIGTSSPDAMLHVAGNAQVDGSIIVKKSGAPLLMQGTSTDLNESGYNYISFKNAVGSEAAWMGYGINDGSFKINKNGSGTGNLEVRGNNSDIVLHSGSNTEHRHYAGGNHVLTLNASTIRNEPNAGQSTMWKVETPATSLWGSNTFCLVSNNSGYGRLFYEIWIWGIHGSYGYAYVSGNVSRYGNEFYVFNNDTAGVNIIFESGLSGDVSRNGISLQRTVTSSSYSYQAVVKTYSPQNISVSVPTGGVLRHKGF